MKRIKNEIEQASQRLKEVGVQVEDLNDAAAEQIGADRAISSGC